MELTTGLALWGAVLSSILGGIRVWDWIDGRRRRRREKDSATPRGELRVSGGVRYPKRAWTLFVELRNIGEADILEPKAVIHLKSVREPIKSNPPTPQPPSHGYPRTLSLEGGVSVLHPGASHTWELDAVILKNVPADLQKTHRVWVQVESRGRVVARLEDDHVAKTIESMREGDGSIPISSLTSSPKVERLGESQFRQVSPIPPRPDDSTHS